MFNAVENVLGWFYVPVHAFDGELNYKSFFVFRNVSNQRFFAKRRALKVDNQCVSDHVITSVQFTKSQSLCLRLTDLERVITWRSIFEQLPNRLISRRCKFIYCMLGDCLFCFFSGISIQLKKHHLPIVILPHQKHVSMGKLQYIDPLQFGCCVGWFLHGSTSLV